MAEFVRVCPAAELRPGCGAVRVVQRTALALFNVDGEFFAIGNNCPHVGGPLGEGELNGSVVTCPLHGWQFDVKTGASPLGRGRVDCYPVKVESGEIFVAL